VRLCLKPQCDRTPGAARRHDRIREGARPPLRLHRPDAGVHPGASAPPSLPTPNSAAGLAAEVAQTRSAISAAFRFLPSFSSTRPPLRDQPRRSVTGLVAGLPRPAPLFIRTDKVVGTINKTKQKNKCVQICFVDIAKILLGFGRIVAAEIEVSNTLANLVESG
jgi:hypothetical protein